jgi:hypothetical protein
MRLVFIHRIHEEDKAPAALQQTWENALWSAWRTAGLAKPSYTLEMPYYGTLLANLSQHTRGVVGNMASGIEGIATRLEEALIHAVGKARSIDEARLRAELDKGVVGSELASWEWMQGIIRLLERELPDFGLFLLRFAREVDGYLTCPEIREAVDGVVRPSLLGAPTVIVAHSLGSIIAYRLLREAESGAEVPLLVTLGSPLGVRAIKQYLNPPSLEVPVAVQTWLNATDERDCVALYARLDRDTFVDGIENVADIQHADDNPHAIADYLGDATVAGRIHAALSGYAASTRRGRLASHAHAASPRIAAPPRRTPA